MPRFRLPGGPLVFLLVVGCGPTTVGTPAAEAPAGPPAAGAQDRVKGWQGDIDFLTQQIGLQHYVYRSRPLPEALRRRVEGLKSNVPRFSDERVLVELLGVMNLLGDGHCYILPAGARRVQSRWLPLRLYLFADGLFVIDADKGHERWVGSRVLRLGKVSAEDAMTRVADFTSRDNAMGVKWIGPFLLRFRGTLEALGLEPGAPGVRLTLADGRGGVVEQDFEFVSVPRLRGLPKLVPSRVPGAPAPPLYLGDVVTPCWFRELPGEKVVYVQFNQVMDGPKETLAAFSRRLGTALKERPPRALVVDVRHNNGGHAELLTPLLGVLEEFERANPRARLVVVTGRNTFSAAQIFIARVNHATRAVFAGEPSGSKPNFVGEENAVVLPWSGAMGSISNRYHESIPGDDRKWIEPEIKVELSSPDYFANRDPVLQAVLKYVRDSPAGGG
jgi:hypothetical protein